MELDLRGTCFQITTCSSYSLEPYLTAVEKNRIFLQGCEIKSGRGRPGFEAGLEATCSR